MTLSATHEYLFLKKSDVAPTQRNSPHLSPLHPPRVNRRRLTLYDNAILLFLVSRTCDLRHNNETRL